MKRQQYFQHRLQTLSALRDAIGAMRSLSAHHYRLARQALPAARQYRDEMNTVVAEIGIHQPLHADVSAGLLVVASDLGLCGDYNRRLSEAAEVEAKRHTVETVYSMGSRALTALTKNSQLALRRYNAPASLDGLAQLLLGLAEDILQDYLARKIGSLYVVSAGFEGVGHFTPLTARVLPIKPLAGAQTLMPSPYLDAAHLTFAAVREYLYITLYEILLDALAAEYGMRLMSTESALDWLEDTAATTSRRLANVRSEAATQELLDIVSGGRGRHRQDTS